MKKKKVIILSRVSADSQELMSQTDKVKAEVLRYFTEDQIIVIENKESAVKKSEEELLGINEMKYYIETSNIAAVYCYELSRLSRRPKVLYILRDYFLDHKVQLVVLNPYFKLLCDDGSLNQGSNIIFALYSSFAETEAKQLKERTVRGKMKKRLEGKIIGGKDLFGYGHDKDGNYFIKEEDAAVIKVEPIKDYGEIDVYRIVLQGEINHLRFIEFIFNKKKDEMEKIIRQTGVI